MQINQLTHRIIGAAIEVHKHLGPGLLESAYEECLFYELKSRFIKVERQVRLPLVYKGIEMENAYRLDLLVENEVIVELKAVESVSAICSAQILTYLKLANKKVGLLINFNVELLVDGVERWVL